MQPKLSLVATSRNDGHGGNILKRMRIFVNGLIHQANKYDFPMELIMVEWNPVPGMPLLSEVLPSPSEDDKLVIRYIIVPDSIHRLFSRGDKIPLYQMIAKNVGIRRALSDWILCTNIDLLFSDPLMAELSQMKLSKDSFYRANRVDIGDELEENWPFEKLIEYATISEIRRLGKDPKYLNIQYAPSWVYRHSLLAAGLNRAYAFKRKKFDDPGEYAFNLLDTNACGDFTLMHRDVWEDIQGYLELDLYSIHIDSMALIGAASLGYKQKVFDPICCTYHIDHPVGWEAMTPIEKISFIQERPGIGFEILWETAKFMLKTPQRFNLNPETWGFSNMKFEEVVVPSQHH